MSNCHPLTAGAFYGAGVKSYRAWKRQCRCDGRSRGEEKGPLIEQTLAIFCCAETAAPLEIQSETTALEENKGGQTCLSVDNGSVCFAMEERQGNPRLWVPLLLILKGLERESLKYVPVQNSC